MLLFNSPLTQEAFWLSGWAHNYVAKGHYLLITMTCSLHCNLLQVSKHETTVFSGCKDKHTLVIRSSFEKE